MSDTQNSYRIYTGTEGSDKFIKVKLDQDYDFLEILSLKIDQEETYPTQNADFGVLIGRVVGNGAIGIPNAKISIFIPITEDDSLRPEIVALYPYETPRDKNNEGKRYNLLPRVGRINPETLTIKPKQPFGSFPIKEEILTNETILEVYEKYYKYTTVTNNAGDYMLFGVPTGLQTVHMSVDITDIGKYSMTPTDMITNLGYSPNLFSETGTRIKEKDDLDDLPHIETQEVDVDIIPYWGDEETFDIGITRQDFRIRAELISTFTIFGSHFTMHNEAVYGDPGRGDKDYGFYRLSNGDFNWWDYVDFRTNRTGTLNLNMYTFNSSLTQEEIDNDLTGSTTNVNTNTDIIKLDTSTYFYYNVEGQFLAKIPCNRRKVITNEFGEEVVVSDDNPNGIFTEFLGFGFLEYENLEITHQSDTSFNGGDRGRNGRLRIKFPQSEYNLLPYNLNTLLFDGTTDNYEESEKWRKKYFKFESGKIYSTAQFFPSKGANDGEETPWDAQYENTLFYNPAQTVGMFKVYGENITRVGELDENNSINFGISGNTGNTGTTTFTYDMPYTLSVSGSEEFRGNYFTGQWLNFSTYFPQIKSAGQKGNGKDQDSADVWFSYFSSLDNDPFKEWFTDNDTGGVFQPLFAGEISTRYVASRASSISTEFIEVPREDLISLNSLNKKGFDHNYLSANSITLIGGNYKYRVPNIDLSGPIDLDRYYNSNASDETYSGTSNYKFFKGMRNSDCVKLIFDLNIL